MLNRLIVPFLLLLPCEISIANTLCTPSEKVLFSCNLKNSKKTASVCAPTNLTSTEGYLQYRFGTQKKLELVYPPTKKSTQELFYWRELRPYQSSLRELTFKSGDYYYTLGVSEGSEVVNDIPGGRQSADIQVGKSRMDAQKVFDCEFFLEDNFHLEGVVGNGDELLGL